MTISRLLSLAITLSFVFIVLSWSASPKDPVSKSASPQAPADLILMNGNIYTVNSHMPHAEAVAARGGLISYVGSNAGAQAFKGPSTEVVDLEGKTVVPGLIDAHGHFINLGESLQRLSFVDTRSYEEIVSMVRKKVEATPVNEWIQGRGWDQTRWATKEFPDHHALSRVSPNNPVWLTRVDGHAALANAAAMKLAGITATTKDPDGGKIVRDPKTGEPTGVFIDNAKSLVEKVIPPLTRDQIKRAATLAIQKCLQDGLTEVHDAGTSAEVIDVYKDLIDAGKFDFRIYAMIMASGDPVKSPAAHTLDAYLKAGPLVGYGNNHLTVRSLKIVSDGAMGSRGAAMLQPYSDDPGNSGWMVMSKNLIYEWAKKATDGGFQVNTHAIGDRANRVWLDVVEQLEKENPKVKDLRLRDEHAQVLSPTDLPRLAELHIIASMQPTHCTSDMRWAEQRLGPQRVRGAYAWRSILRTGVRIAGGSDFPVEDPNPLWGIYSAITRQDHSGWPTGGWMPQEKMTRDEALRAFTLDAAYAAFEEKIKGSIEVGKLADFVVLSQDIMKIEPAQILRTEVEKTFLGGKLVFGKVGQFH
ncbi:MAG: amidohydrolase [Acidobacteriia bacterium]|nr:amidohydrolase [Terriglobia bacterium]